MQIDMNDLISNVERLHTTDMGQVRMRRNLGLVDIDVIPVLRKHILSPSAQIIRRGKNWYVYTNNWIITINASSFSVITAHHQHM